MKVNALLLRIATYYIAILSTSIIATFAYYAGIQPMYIFSGVLLIFIFISLIEVWREERLKSKIVRVVYVADETITNFRAEYVDLETVVSAVLSTAKPIVKVRGHKRQYVLLRSDTEFNHIDITRIPDLSKSSDIHKVSGFEKREVQFA